MEMPQTAESCPVQGQTAVKAGLPSSPRVTEQIQSSGGPAFNNPNLAGASNTTASAVYGAEDRWWRLWRFPVSTDEESRSYGGAETGTPSDARARFRGDGVRYKAKLIGIDPVPDAQGNKMCWDSMMKLKGLEEVARKQGKHKLRVWLKISSSGLKIVDERSGIVLHNHEKSQISCLTKDKFDPRALAYIYQHEDTYVLFYIKMANQADPVLLDISEVCQAVDQETSQESAEMQNISLVPLNESSGSTIQGAATEEVFSPTPDLSSGQSNQPSSTNELMEVFSKQLEEPLSPSLSSSSTSQPEPPQQMLSTAQIVSMFSTQPAGGSPYPAHSPTTMPWAPQGLQGHQWAGHWPTMPGSMPGWAPLDVTAPPAGGQPQSPQPGFMMEGNATGSTFTATGTTGALGPTAVDSLSLL